MKARELMTGGPACCTPDDTARDAARSMRESDCGLIPIVESKDIERTMADRQVRRVVIVDDQGDCAGIIAQADIARAANRGRSQDITEQEVGLLVEVISQPSRGESHSAQHHNAGA